MTKTDNYLIQNLSELKEISRGLLDNQKVMAENLKTLNDNNILHAQKNEDQHKEIFEQMKLITTKYWWLIIILLGAVFIVLGYKEIAANVIKVG